MRKVILYIAVSIDGYIADLDGKVDWIDSCEIPEEVAGCYDRFIAGIDTVVMGWRTYHQIVTELSPDNWIYTGLQSYVITHRHSKNRDDIQFTDEALGGLIRRLKTQAGKDIWVCGGASIVNQLMAEGLVDVLHLTVIPVALGSGIRLFNEGLPFSKYSLTKLNQYADIIELIYSSNDLSVLSSSM